MNVYGAMVEVTVGEKLKQREKSFTQCWWQVNKFEWGNGGMILTGEKAVVGEKIFTDWLVDK